MAFKYTIDSVNSFVLKDVLRQDMSPPYRVKGLEINCKYSPALRGGCMHPGDGDLCPATGGGAQVDDALA